MKSNDDGLRYGKLLLCEGDHDHEYDYDSKKVEAAGWGADGAQMSDQEFPMDNDDEKRK